jgi:hypothetical protein
MTSKPPAGATIAVLETARESVTVAPERLLRKTRTLSDVLSDKLEQTQRRSSCLEALITGPATKLVQLADDLPTLNAMGKRFLKDNKLPPYASCGSVMHVKAVGKHSATRVMTCSTLVPILASAVMLLARCYLCGRWVVTWTLGLWIA